MNRADRRAQAKANRGTGLVNASGQEIKKQRKHAIDVLLAMPTYGAKVEIDTRADLTNMMKYSAQYGVRVQVCQTDGPLVYKNRNDSVDVAYQVDAEHVLFVDADMVFEPDSLMRLLTYDKDVVAGLCTLRMPPFMPTVYYKNDCEGGNGGYTSYDDAKPGELPLNALVPCDATGSAFILIKRSVFDKLEKPYYACPPVDDAVMGEDMYFCNALAKAGVELFVDTGLIIGHLGLYPFTYLDRIGYLKSQRELKEKSGDNTELTASKFEGGIRKAAGAGVSEVLRASSEAAAIPSVES